MMNTCLTMNPLKLEKLTLSEFTATVLIFDIISSGDNGDDAKCLVWGFQELLAE